MTAKTYEELLSEAQSFIKRDVATRFKMAKLLVRMHEFESQNKIALDLGWSSQEVGQYIRVVEVWGDRRIPEKVTTNEYGTWVRPASWRDYAVVSPRGMNPHIRERYIKACLEYGPDGPAALERAEMRKATAERARLKAEEIDRQEKERQEARANMTALQRKRESQAHTSMYVSFLDEHVRNEFCRYMPKIEELDKRSRTVLENLYDDLVREFAKLGIVELPEDLKESA